MKSILLLILISISVITHAQVKKVSLQASGLTCSMCSNAINKSLRTLEFVDAIKADFKTYTFEISFKTGSSVDFEKIKKKVEDAGFSVSGFVATIYFDNIELKENQSLKIDTNTLLFINQNPQALNGEIKVKLLDKGFISSKEYKRIDLPKTSGEPGIYHVII